MLKEIFVCKISYLFTGILVYADDTVLLAPLGRQALQLMVDTCSSYATEHNLIFSINVDPSKNKTKYMFFPYSQESNVLDLYPILLNGLNLPYVSNGQHLGNTLDSQIKNKDICVKRSIAISKFNGVLHEFHFAHPSTKCILMSKYCTSFYVC